ncbi:hypothetical protein [Streptomyces lavendulae]|uniref:hypothetical protein n=1 Tax=Streptomyces lavendulae TaxID=1914 RepID=UPI0024A41F21|nr:hypothetical protein [Streptomyces lavendulae]GLW04305.1 hypothetical protein Slala05_79350 [Streptomyces lavendulae subsp. lavendulae]
MKGMEHKRQAPGIGREEQVQEHPGPDPVHPEASKPVRGKTPEDPRRRQERAVPPEDDG